MSENPDEWRSTVDAASGRTYWYHRKTRVSTWVRPDFWEIPEQPNVPSNVQPQQEIRQQQSLDKISRHVFGTMVKSIYQDPNSSSQAHLTSLLLEIQQPTTLDPTEASNNISGLTNIVIQSCGEKCNSSAISARRTGLRCLWWLSNAHDRFYAGEHFYADQSWTSLFQFTARWKPVTGNTPQGDVESLLLLGALMSNLLVGPTAQVISTEASDGLADLIASLRNADAGTGLMDSLFSTHGGSVLCDRTVQTFALLAEKGHRLPGAWIITVFTHALRSERAFEQLVLAGGLPALQALCMSSRLDQGTRSAAKDCLLAAMANSSFVRERVLTGFLELGRDLACVPVPMGPEPILYAPAPATAPSTGTVEEERPQQADDGQDSDDEHALPIGEEGEEQESAAQVRYGQIIASGYNEALVVPRPRNNDSRDDLRAEEEENGEESEVWNSFQRDVEWIPKAGTPWRLSSSMLWARCPALRELISGFWDEGGGGLELSIDASDEVLACLCRYMHSGLLLLPLRTSRQLQLLRVASELGMESLFLAAAEQVQHKLTLDNVAAVVGFSAEHGFEGLERACRAFLAAGGKVPTNIRLQRTDPQLQRNASLRDVVASSIQDVNAVLGQQPLPATKLRIEPRGPLLGTSTAAPSSAAAVRQQASLQPPFNGSTHLDDGSYAEYGQGSSIYRPEPSFLRELDEQPDEPADPYEMSQLSLLDIASGEASLSRGNSYSADPNSMYADVDSDYSDSSLPYGSVQGYSLSGGNSNPRSHAGSNNNSGSGGYGGNRVPAKGKGAKGKGSGGIYGLLLQNSGGEEAQYYEPPSSAGIVPMRANQVPGRVVGEGSKPRTQPPGGASGAAAAAGARGAVAKSGATAAAGPESTPRTQRATSLLAAARPSGLPHYSDDYSFEQDYDSGGSYDSGDRHIESARAGTGPSTKRSSGGPQEFVKQMSLAPQRPLTPNEKRLERLTRPTKALGLNTKTAEEEAAEDVTESTGEEVGSPASSADQAITPTLRPASSASPKPQLHTKTQGERAAAPTKLRPITASESGEYATEAASRAPAALPPGIIALKRSVSPSTATSQNSREGHLVSLGSALPTVSGSSGPQSPPPRSEINVRGSLTLLKTKAASSRRRRSVADIEGAQSGNNGDADGIGMRNSTDRAPVFPDDGPPCAAPTPAAAPPRSNQPVPALRAAPPRVELDLTGFLADDAEGQPPLEEDVDKVQCRHCSRFFIPESCERHMKVCEKVFIRKRKAFDSAKMRIEGNPDLKEFVEHGGGEGAQPQGRGGQGPATKKGVKPALERKPSAKEAGAPATAAASAASAKWKHQSEAFRAALRNARETSAAIASGAPLPPPVASAIDPSMKQCPHCNRRFNAQAAERHIPVCQSIRAKPAALKRGGGGNASNGGTGGAGGGGMASTSSKSNRGWQ